jgi:hypothetical protein
MSANPSAQIPGVSAELGAVIPVSIWKNRVVWGAFALPAWFVWACIVGWQKGDGWPVAAAFIWLAFVVLTTPSAEQALKGFQLASVMKAGVTLNSTATAASSDGTATTTASATTPPANAKVDPKAKAEPSP